MACDCIANVNADFAARGENTVVDRILLIEPFFHESNALVATKVDKPKRGARPKRLLASHCPFCGVKYEPAKKTEPEAAHA